MSRIQIRNPDALVFAALYTLQGVVSYLWSRGYPDRANYYLPWAVTCLVFGLIWAWRAMTGKVEEYRQGRLSVAVSGLLIILLVGWSCWGAYSAHPESHDGLAVRMAYALEALVALVAASYFVFGRRRILAHMQASSTPAI
eukprot:gene15845-16008_t